jgi:hypothetical protein
MSGFAETSEIQGTVLRSKQVTVRGVAVTQTAVKTNDGLVMCMWRSANPVLLTDNAQYSFKGQLRAVDGRRMMIEPSYTLITVKKGGRKAVKKYAIIAAVVAVVGFGILLPVGLSAKHKHQVALKPVIGANNLPPAYDAAGKVIPNTPNDCDLKAIPFTSTDKKDPNMISGQTRMAPTGVNGQDKVCYVHGRALYPVVTHVKKPVNQIRLIGTAPVPK